VYVESTLALAAATWAIAMALGPVLQIRKIVAYRNSDSVSVGYFLVLFVGFLLWIAYGVAAGNLALIIPNAVAAAVIVLTIVVALHFRRDRDQPLRAEGS
jgi:MtN3 and saliva related transmembrane protein